MTQLAQGFDVGRYHIQPPSTVPNYTPDKVIQAGIQILLVTAVVLSLIIIIYSGIQYVLAQGDKTKIQAARNRLIYAIIGLILIFLSFAIISIIGTFFHVEFIK